MDQPEFSIQRDRLAPKLAELARKLAGTPSPAVIALVRGELERIAQG